ncbi:MAG TPA: cytochrome d ubiquinol oxidase subunit II [Dictyobacter sp.]|jgi:cytochrome d ubiquinol oxidase subunit II|nr:cytochrome d ubiquinol oxidase subunit II [Dictyobacter sp.]
MGLQIIWLGVIALLLTAFVVLEGFDYGVGILLPFLGKNDTEKSMVMGSIGPFWDGNEVCLIAAGGCMFAAFPTWYSTLFSGMYLEFFFILFALILRGAGFEFRGLHDSPRWKTAWTWVIFVGSVLPGFLWGIIVANLVRGLPVNAHLDYVGTVLSPLNPFALLCGLTAVVLFTLHGAIFVSLRVTGDLVKQAMRVAQIMWIPTLILFFLVALVGFNVSTVFHHMIVDVRIVPLGYITLAAIASIPFLLRREKTGWAFGMTTVAIILIALVLGTSAFPNVMVSSLNPSWSLTISNSATAPYTLTVVSWIGLTLIPIIIIYQIWSYWIFRQRIQPHAIGGHY